MFDISFWEILVIFLVAFVTIGPQQMLRMSYKMGRWVRYFRHSLSAISNEINQELNLEMVSKENNTVQKAASSEKPKEEKPNP